MSDDVTFEGLGEFNPEVIPRPTEEVDLEQIWVEDFSRHSIHTRVIAFDQAIANTGWCIVSFQVGFPPQVEQAGTIKTETLNGRTSWDDTLERSQRLLGHAYELIFAEGVDLVLHEMPPVGNGPFMRGSWSSIVAATAVRGAAFMADIPVFHVSAQSVKKYLTEDANAKKKKVREAIDKLTDDGRLLMAGDIRLNEHIVDAIGIALTWEAQQ